MPAKDRSARRSSIANQTGNFLPSLVSYSENDVNGTRHLLFGTEPPLPMHARGIADVRYSAVRLWPQQLCEIDTLALASNFVARFLAVLFPQA